MIKALPEPLADLFGIEGVLVTGAVTDKFANQLQTAIMAKGLRISRLPAMIEYPVKRYFRENFVSDEHTKLQLNWA